MPEPRRIRLLPLQLANQIAAGEVVERPASVAKELVENSLDAGADEVLVEAEEGGVRLLRVRDNGSGIERDDLPLALSRHATSKIADPRDLLGITSLGFRGEALASIASVARLRLTSRARHRDAAWSVAGEHELPVPAAHPEGTTVEVRDLFHNLPARRKFLRAERTEYEHLEETVRRLALGNFQAGFTLRHNGRVVFALPPAPEQAMRERRLAAIAGRAFLEHAAAIEFEAAGLRLHGWIGARGYSRSAADVQYVYLNGRAVRDRVLSHALRQGFEEVLSDGRYAAYVLYLEMDPAQVDVNVHPTKHEVRFREARLVHDFLVSAVRGALGEARRWDAPPASAREMPTAGIAEVRSGYDARTDMPPAPGRERPVRRFQRLGTRFVVVVEEELITVVDALALVRGEARAALCAALETGAVAPRALLIPATVRAGAAAVREGEARAEALRRFGLDLQPVSAETVRLFAVPDVGADFDPASLVLAALRAPLQGEDGAMVDALAGAARLPASDHELGDLVERAAHTPGLRLALDEARLARLLEQES